MEWIQEQRLWQSAPSMEFLKGISWHPQAHNVKIIQLITNSRLKSWAHKHLASLLLPKTLVEILAYRTYPSSPGMRKNGGLGSWLKDCPPFKAFMIDIWANGTSPVAPALCHLNSTSSTPWFHITNFGFWKLLKGDRILQLWAFCLVREGTVGTKNLGTNPGLFIKKVDWGAWNHDQALLYFQEVGWRHWPTESSLTLHNRSLGGEVDTC